MFEILVNKENNNELKRFIIPQNNGYNCFSWILITIKGKDEFNMKRYSSKPDIVDKEWELNKNYAFPSALMTEFLRLDFEDDELKVYL